MNPQNAPPFATRLHRGQLAFILSYPGSEPRPVHAAPTGRSPRLALLPLNSVMRIIDGPQISEDKRIWWYVRTFAAHVDPGSIAWRPTRPIDGWIAEGEPGRYYLAPVWEQVRCPRIRPSRINLGDRAMVSYEPPAPNNVRTEPGEKGRVVGVLQPGQQFAVTWGPECVDGMIWWQVAVDRILGWTSEGNHEHTWIEPIVKGMYPALIAPS